MSEDADQGRALVGMLHDPVHPSAGNIGIAVALEQFVQALGASARRYRYELFCDPRQLARLRARVPPGCAHVRASSRSALVDRLDGLAPAAWHDSGFDTFRPFALRARARRPFPVTLLHHSLSYKSLLHDAFLRLLLARPLACDAIVCTSRAARVALEKLLAHVADRFREAHGLDLAYRGRLDEIPLGVDTERFRPGDPGAARARLDLAADARVLLWVGRLTPIDKADLVPLLLVFARLVERNPARALLLVLAGTQRPGEAFGERLQARARALGLGERVRIRRASDAELPDLYRAADVFVSPVDSPQEALGIAPLEAMACGLPQVVSDWDGYRDTVVDGETGFLVPTLWCEAARDIDREALLSDPALDHLALAQSVAVDPGALERAVQRLLDNPGLRAAMGEASRARSLARYAWPVVVERYEALWAELARRCAGERRAGPPPDAYALPRYFDVFRHYATDCLGPDMAVALTASGRRALDEPGALQGPLGDDWPYLDPGTLRLLLESLTLEGNAPVRWTVRKLVDGLAPGGGAARDRTVRHLMWLVKYGLVTVSPARGPGARAAMF